MYRSIQRTTAIDPTSWSPVRRGFLFVPLAVGLACFVLSPAVFSVTPAPDGDYPNQNTAEGHDALLNLTTGYANTALGFEALENNDAGVENTATGFDALHNNGTGYSNTATGSQALFLNGDGGYNTATGNAALYGNGSGFFNTATGYGALASNAFAQGNTATGSFSLTRNTSGGGNTATGYFALSYTEAGGDNTASGAYALQSNTTGYGNTASGEAALFSNTTGHNNTADGLNALGKNTTGSNNVAQGRNAGTLLTTGDNNIDIGANVVGAAGEANTIRIGKRGVQKATFVAGIDGTAVSGKQVIVTSTGKLGIATSSARFKQAIKPIDKASEAILALKPVSFRYNDEIDPTSIPQFGLIAEQVEKINPDLVGYDENGEVDSVRYEAVNAMLLNEFLKEHRKVEDLEGKTQIGERKAQTQEATIAQLKKQVEALSSTVQKVSDQMVLSKPAPQLVAGP